MSTPNEMLAARFRAGQLSEFDRDMIARTLAQQPVPPGELRRQRYRLYREYRDRVCPNVKDIRAQARIVFHDAKRYEASGWREDEHAISLPDNLKGKPRALLWQARKLGKVPSESTLRLSILPG